MYNKVSVKSPFNKNQKLNLMGAKVKVYTELAPKIIPPESYGGNGRRQWNLIPVKSRVGWIVGFRTVYDGICHSRSYCYDYEGYDRGYLQITRSIAAVLVSYTPYKKPVYVPVDGFSLDPDGKSDFRELHWDEIVKQDAKDWVKSIPRDKNGRWISVYKNVGR